MKKIKREYKVSDIPHEITEENAEKGYDKFVIQTAILGLNFSGFSPRNPDNPRHLESFTQSGKVPYNSRDVTYNLRMNVSTYFVKSPNLWDVLFGKKDRYSVCWFGVETDSMWDSFKITNGDYMETHDLEETIGYITNIIHSHSGIGGPKLNVDKNLVGDALNRTKDYIFNHYIKGREKPINTSL